MRSTARIDKVKAAADRLDDALETRNVDRMVIAGEALLEALAGEAIARAALAAMSARSPVTGGNK